DNPCFIAISWVGVSAARPQPMDGQVHWRWVGAYMDLAINWRPVKIQEDSELIEPHISVHNKNHREDATATNWQVSYAMSSIS
ncbi:hypothetical protein A2U01_0081347, partial [Trifolium medium]|nr:hypothetical protein [Trifolium medium]